MIDQQTSFLVSAFPDLSTFITTNTLLSFQGVQAFQDLIYSYYNTYGRMFAWRTTHDPYYIMVSEVMLQQTQTYRVEKKYEQFIKELSTFTALAGASNAQVLTLWQGLGYNRRALNLQKAAQKIVTDYAGKLPQEPSLLKELPGIGAATASSICAFAFNVPTVFIETNIRTVFIQLFFPHETAVHDRVLFPLIEQTLDSTQPRQWYYALMDYGVMLKKLYKNPSRKSVHHTVQSKFKGSIRQIRGAVIRILTQSEQLTELELITLLTAQLSCSAEKVVTVLETLYREQAIKKQELYYKL